MGSYVPEQSEPSKYIREPLKYNGSLDKYESSNVTPILGTEFSENLQLADLLFDNEKLRDVAILASQRGVLFFRNQRITPEQQKFLTDKLGLLTGKPTTSGIHKHPVFSNKKHGVAVDKEGHLDDYILPISSEITRKILPERWASEPELKPLASIGWHTDIVYEKVPSDYATLHAVCTPSDGSGGDTVWASAYEAYDRLSPPLRRLFDGLTGLHDRSSMAKDLKKHDLPSVEGRGAPQNADTGYVTTHPIVRTNPVTGWKGIFGLGAPLQIGGINGVTKAESAMLYDYLFRLIVENHDLQVRFRWEENDLALWDNRSCFHTATYDYKGKRQANLVIGNGEVPYFDPASKSRREALLDGLDSDE